MKQKPLKEYIEKLVDYNVKNNNDISTLFNVYFAFTDKYELIKSCRVYVLPNLFNRYMNNSKWKWK